MTRAVGCLARRRMGRHGSRERGFGPRCGLRVGLARSPEVLGIGLATDLLPRVGRPGLTPGPLPCGAALAAGTVRSYIHTSLHYIATNDCLLYKSL